ncbi:hypothetical protein [Phytohabitans rumicis]|uniref:Uncharacterized protein n=1 Tax=Phytohabitans rumicis TaxID=1076125 RepID=A0A6V8L9W9_9ACTN|nr:hypothetical protein [Phytohabitans rumicis]GFJ91591.1 hypothetical protein Prum_052330 [Phytohabitans rumicis]
MSWQSGPSTDEPTLITDLFALIDSSIRQGRAIERVDQAAAAAAYRDGLAALGRILQRVGENRVGPAELLITPEPVGRSDGSQLPSGCERHDQSTDSDHVAPPSTVRQ